MSAVMLPFEQPQDEEHTLTLVHIPANLIFVDDSYQRARREKTLAKLRKEWDAYLAGAILVSPRPNGTYAAIDGQHRYLVMVERGWKTIPCFVKPMAQRTEEANTFIMGNLNHKRPEALDIFRAERCRGDEEPTMIERILTERGFHLPGYKTGSTEYGKIQAVEALRRIYRAGYLPQTLDFIKTAWAGQQEAMVESVLLGVYLFLATYPEHDPKRLLNRAKAKTVAEISQRARRFASLSKSTAGPAFRDALFELYNYKAPEHQKLRLKGEEA